MQYNMKQHAALFLGILLLVLAGNHTVLCQQGGEYDICQPGNFWSNSECHPCPAGTYLSFESFSTSCEECPAGHSSDVGAADCYRYIESCYESDGQTISNDCTFWTDSRDHPRNGACPPGQHPFYDANGVQTVIWDQTLNKVVTTLDKEYTVTL